MIATHWKLFIYEKEKRKLVVIYFMLVLIKFQIYIRLLLLSSPENDAWLDSFGQKPVCEILIDTTIYSELCI